MSYFCHHIVVCHYNSLHCIVKFRINIIQVLSGTPSFYFKIYPLGVSIITNLICSQQFRYLVIDCYILRVHVYIWNKFIVLDSNPCLVILSFSSDFISQLSMIVYFGMRSRAKSWNIVTIIPFIFKFQLMVWGLCTEW